MINCQALKPIYMNPPPENQELDHRTELLLRTLRWLLRPLVRLLITHGITFPLLRKLLKGLYVEVALETFSQQDKPPTDSRLFVLTGIHRKDIKLLKKLDEEQQLQSFRNSTLGAEIIAHWLGSREFIHSDGSPRNLLRNPADGEAGFDALVASVNKDVRPPAVLEEWLRLGIVSLDPQGRISLNQQAFVPSTGFDEKAWFLGKHLHDHIAACAHNLQDLQPPMLERSVYYSRLTPQSVEQLNQYARQKGIELLQALNQQALASQQADQGKPEADQRFRFGLYWYHEALQDTPAQPTSEQDPS